MCRRDLATTVLVVLLAWGCHPVTPPREAPFPPRVEEAVQHFLPCEIDRELAADGFEHQLHPYQFHESTAIGGGGNFSPHVRAFRTILESAEADRAFKRLLREAPPAGQLYALCGLYWTDKAFFDEAVKPYLTDFREIVAQSGCVLWRRPIREVVAGHPSRRNGIVTGQLPREFAGANSRFVATGCPQ